MTKTNLLLTVGMISRRRRRRGRLVGAWLGKAVCQWEPPLGDGKPFNSQCQQLKATFWKEFIAYDGIG